jgi:hypothetical protein
MKPIPLPDLETIEPPRPWRVALTGGGLIIVSGRNTEDARGHALVAMRRHGDTRQITGIRPG